MTLHDPACLPTSNMQSQEHSELMIVLSVHLLAKLAEHRESHKLYTLKQLSRVSAFALRLSTARENERASDTQQNGKNT